MRGSRLRSRGGPGAERLAIRPYPKGLEEEVALDGGQRFLVRPIRPEDEPALQAIFAHLTPEQIRMRFFAPLKSLSHAMAVRITQVDYDREMGLVLSERGVPGRAEIYGVVQLIADPDNERAEYAILVRGDMTGRGLGTLLMRRMIAYCRSRGIGEINGDVLRENAPMRRLCKKLGFVGDPPRRRPGHHPGHGQALRLGCVEIYARMGASKPILATCGNVAHSYSARFGKAGRRRLRLTNP